MCLQAGGDVVRLHRNVQRLAWGRHTSVWHNQGKSKGGRNLLNSNCIVATVQNFSVVQRYTHDDGTQRHQSGKDNPTLAADST